MKYTHIVRLHRVALAWGLAAGLLFMATSAAALPTELVEEIARLIATDADSFDQLGVAVAIDGTTAVVGAHREDSQGGSSGAAYIFERDQGGPDSWGQVKKLIASDGAADDRFGFSVAIDGDTVVIGARGDNDLGFDSGSAYVFERDEGGAGNWGQVKKLLASDGSTEDEFGYSVTIAGDTIAIGARFAGAAATEAGAVYLFERDLGGAGNWGELLIRTASDAAAGDHLGYAVALSRDAAEDILVAGAQGSNAGAFDSGAAYLFARDEGGPNAWGERKQLVASDAGAGDAFGRAVAIAGDLVIVGAPLADTAGLDAGAAYLFERDQGGVGLWGEVVKLVASDAAVEDELGNTVAALEDVVAVGAPRHNDTFADTGATYLFERHAGGVNQWGQTRRLAEDAAETGDELGAAVAMTDDILLVGVVRDDTVAGSDAGSVLAYGLPSPVLRLPRHLPAVGGQTVEVPVELVTSGQDLIGLSFTLTFDPCLIFDAADADMDGLPDDLALELPADFSATAGLVDGDLDVDIDADMPGALLVDGVVARVSFTVCSPIGASELAAVGFAADPEVVDALGRTFPVPAASGVVEASTTFAGDCNFDGGLTVADAVACQLEIFDGDGAVWLDAFDGTFFGHPEGCDANSDLTIDAGDVACKARLLFGLTCDPPALVWPGAASPAAAKLSGAPRLVASMPRVDSGTVKVRLRFEPGAFAVSSVAVSLDLDTARLAFDFTDGNGDGLPDAVRFLGPGASMKVARFDPGDAAGELDLLIADLAPAPRLRTEGAMIEIELARLGGADLEGAVRFAASPRASFGTASGRGVAGEAENSPPPMFADDFESGLLGWSRHSP